SSQQAASWTEPPWSGWIETTGDALLILEAAKRGIIPRVTRRLVDSERKMIMSGSVFVFEEEESGIRRWTDGFYWSPSRILGNFLLYRETDKRSAAHRGGRADIDMSDVNEATRVEGHSLSRPRADSSAMGVDRHRERNLVGSLTNTYKFKPDGLMKKTFSLTINGVAQHLISYYKVEDVESGRLRSPSSLPELSSLDISPEYLDKTHFRNPPKVEIGVDGIPRYRGEADDIDTSPNPTSPFSPSACTILSPPEPKRGNTRNRFEPYRPKRPRKNTQDSQPDSNTPPAESPIATNSTIPTQTNVQYPNPSGSSSVVPTPPPQTPTPQHYPPYGIPAYYPPYGHPPPPGAVYGHLPP
ncbi:Gti1/Pac2 family-domain-containing protein, partial [Panaeolus papilionaceus]